jgi:hypothetical protein
VSTVSFVLLALLLASCDVRMPGQDVAMRTVWQETYGAPWDAPYVEWRTDDCGDGTKAGALVDGVCYSGLTVDWSHCIIAWRGSFSVSSFDHELLHAFQARQYVSDSGHVRAEWGLEFGHERGLLDDAREALKKGGL